MAQFGQEFDSIIMLQYTYLNIQQFRLTTTTTTLQLFIGRFSRVTWVSQYQNGKTSLDLNEARDDGVLGSSGISWTIRKQSASRSRQITTPTSHHSIFTGRMLFLTPNQQCQSTVQRAFKRIVNKVMICECQSYSGVSSPSGSFESCSPLCARILSVPRQRWNMRIC